MLLGTSTPFVLKSRKRNLMPAFLLMIAITSTGGFLHIGNDAKSSQPSVDAFQQNGVQTASDWVEKEDMVCHVTGTVVDESGKPCPKVTVFWGAPYSQFESFPEVTSDENGRFSITADIRNVYRHSLFANDHDQTLFGVHPIANGEQLANDIMLLQDDHLLKDIRLVLRKTTRIRGKVVDKNGNAVADAIVMPSNDPTPPVKTDGQGNFILRTAVPTGEIIACKSRVGIGSIHWTARPEHGIDLPEPIILKVPYEPVKIQMTDYRGNPLSNVGVNLAHVNIRPSQPNERPFVVFGFGTPFQISDERGFVTLDVPGSLEHKENVYEFAVIAAPFDTVWRISMNACRKNADGVWLIPRPSLLCTRGTVVYPDSKPAANIRIVGQTPEKSGAGPALAITDRNGRYELYARRSLNVTSAVAPNDHRFFNDMPYMIATLDEQWGAVPQIEPFHHRSDGAAHFIHRHENDQDSDPKTQYMHHDESSNDPVDHFVNFTLQKNANVKGKLTNQANEKTIAGSEVLLNTEDHYILGNIPNDQLRTYEGTIPFMTRRTKTDQDGNYEFNVSPGIYTLTVPQPSNIADKVAKTVAITKSDVYEENLIVNRSQISGKLELESPGEIAFGSVRVKIKILSKSTGPHVYYQQLYDSECLADENGNFSFENVPEGIVFLFAMDDAGKYAVMTPLKDKNSPSVLKLQKTLTFSGRLLDKETKQPIAETKVSIPYWGIPGETLESGENARSKLEDIGPVISNGQPQGFVFADSFRFPKEATTDEQGHFVIAGIPGEGAVFPLAIAKRVPEKLRTVSANAFPMEAPFQWFGLPEQQNRDVGDISVPKDFFNLSGMQLEMLYVNHLSELFDVSFEKLRKDAEKDSKPFFVFFMKPFDVTGIGGNPEAMMKKRKEQEDSQRFLEMFYYDEEISKLYANYDLLCVMKNTRAPGSPPVMNAEIAMKLLKITDEDLPEPILFMIDGKGNIQAKIPLSTIASGNLIMKAK